MATDSRTVKGQDHTQSQAARAAEQALAPQGLAGPVDSAHAAAAAHAGHEAAAAVASAADNATVIVPDADPRAGAERTDAGFDPDDVQPQAGADPVADSALAAAAADAGLGPVDGNDGLHALPETLAQAELAGAAAAAQGAASTGALAGAGWGTWATVGGAAVAAGVAGGGSSGGYDDSIVAVEPRPDDDDDDDNGDDGDNGDDDNDDPLTLDEGFDPQTLSAEDLGFDDDDGVEVTGATVTATTGTITASDLVLTTDANGNLVVSLAPSGANKTGTVTLAVAGEDRTDHDVTRDVTLTIQDDDAAGTGGDIIRLADVVGDHAEASATTWYPPQPASGQQAASGSADAAAVHAAEPAHAGGSKDIDLLINTTIQPDPGHPHS